MTNFDQAEAKHASKGGKQSHAMFNDAFVSFRDAAVADMDKDIYLDPTSPTFEKQPLLDADASSEMQVLIVGGGFYGLMIAHRLVTEGGIRPEDMVLVDRAGGWGGTWYWNRYPGAMCDIEGACYLPLLEETGHVPSYRYPPGYEIREQCCRIAEKFNLKGQFSTTVTHQRWDEENRRWIVTLNRSSTGESFVIRTQFLVNATGVIASPNIPKLNGVELFRSNPSKTLMHTGRWDWTLSGGSQENPEMTKLAGKRVGIIGTGATSVQVMPLVAKWAGHTYLFQRTPCYVGPHSQAKMTPEDWSKVAYKPGWQYERMTNFDQCMVERSKPGLVDMVNDGWTQVPALAGLFGSDDHGILKPGKEEEGRVQAILELDFPWTEKMRARVDQEVEDPKTAAQLKGWSPGFCKRATFHEEYLSSFNKPNVTLVDTKGEGVTAYTNNGVVANGDEYELDVLILATGYLAGVIDSCPEHSLNAPIIGSGQRSLRDKWDKEDFGALYGLATHGFPNLFFYSAAGAGVSNNQTTTYSTTARVIAKLIREARRQAENSDMAVIEAMKEAEDCYSDMVVERSTSTSSGAKCAANAFLAGGDGDNQEMDAAKVEIQAKLKAKKSPWGGGVLGFQRMLNVWLDREGAQGFAIY